MGENRLDIWISPIFHPWKMVFDHQKYPNRLGQRQNDGDLPWCRWNPFGTTSSWQLRSREVTGPAYGRGPRQWPTLGVGSGAIACDWKDADSVLFGFYELETSKFKDFQPMGFSRCCLTYWPLLTSSGVRFDVFFLGIIPSPPTMTSESWGSGSRHVTTLSALVVATRRYRGLSMIRALSTWPTIEQICLILLLIGVASYCMVGEAHWLPDDVFSLMAHVDARVTYNYWWLYNILQLILFREMPQVPWIRDLVKTNIWYMRGRLCEATFW